MYVYNCVVYCPTEQIDFSLVTISTELKKFPEICTHLVQPLDQLVLCELKSLLCKKWNVRRSELSVAKQHFASKICSGSAVRETARNIKVTKQCRKGSAQESGSCDS